MAKLRNANAYRRIKRAFTRTSKYKKKSFIKGIPGTKIHLFDMGNLQAKFPLKFQLVAKKEVNLRHNALEAGRMTATHTLAGKYGKKGFAMHVHAIPHHVMRENALATGAGADRMQTGMRHSFGKPIGKSCPVRKGKVIFSVDVQEGAEPFAREALRKASAKFPIPCKVVQVK
jgi:large subunit ribosomal protein L10e